MGIFQIGKQNKKQQELANTLEAEQFKTGVIIDSITDGVIVTNSKGTVELLNDSAATLLGWDREEALQLDYRSLVKVVPEDGKEIEPDAISKSMSTKASVQKLSQLETRSLRHLYVDIVASPITQKKQDKEGMQTEVIGTIAVLRNVDEQKRAEQQRSDFISTASHEMRTPVASIQGFIELALNPKVSSIDDKARDYLTKAHEATKHLGDLFQDLLTVSKSEDGRLVSNPTVIDINEFLVEIVEQAQVPAQKKNLKLILAEPESNGKAVKPLLYVHVDRERLHEVIDNLIENALKYTKQGSVTVGAGLTDSGVLIRVSDTGIGIAAEDIPHLFQKFYRTDNSETREIGGTGLGLYITKQIVELMGGRIWVESTPGTGSTFNVQLPRISSDEVARLQQAQELNQSPQGK